MGATAGRILRCRLPGRIFSAVKFPLPERGIEWLRNDSEVTFMWFNSGNNCSCLWWIIIIILLLCCCGGWGNSCGNNCGCNDDCRNNNCC